MSDPAHRELREMLGWYAIRRTTEAENARIEAHLDGCAACRAELVELRSTLTQLDLVDANRIDERPSPPPQLGDDVIRHVLQSSAVAPHPRTRRLMLAAAAAAVLAVGLGAGWLIKPDPVPLAGPPTEPVSVQVDAGSLEASAHLINHTWGVEIQMTAVGFEPGQAYQVQMISTTGERSSAGEFVGTGTNPMKCNLNSAVLRPDAAGFEVLDDDGAVVLTSNFT